MDTLRSPALYPFDASKMLTIVQKKEEPTKSQEQEIPLTCHEIRSVQKDLRYGTPKKADRAAKMLGQIAYKLAAMLEVQHHITRGLHKALDLEKKRRQRGKRLNLLGEEGSGPIFFSPSKVRKARDLQQAKVLEE
jgi:hypothetical protein